MATISLQDGEQARLSITKTQEDEISRLYHQVYLKYKKELNSLPLKGQGTVSQSLRRSYLNKLTKQLNEAYKSLGEGLEKQVRKGMQDVSQAVVLDVNAWAKKAGMKVEGAYSYVPRDTVALVSSGKLYGEGWTLSKAIWGESQKHADDINKIVAAGIAGNQSAYDIAKALETYVNPSAKKEWNWSKVYPGTSKKIDYNAQRLARTMVSHAYQQSLLTTTKHNPFVKGYKWRSAHTHRTCEICNERDGKVYTADTLPLDHPNGLCTFLVESDKLNDVADRLGDWANGANDPALDKWYQSMGGEVTSKPVPASKKTKAVNGDMKVRSTKWIDKNLSNLRKGIQASWGENEWKNLQSYLLNLNEDQLKWLASGNSILKEIFYDGRSYFRPSEGVISLDLIMDQDDSFFKNPEGKYTTLFHEYGHLLDCKHGSGDNSLSGSKKFGKALYKSLEKEYNNLIDENGWLKQEIRKELRYEDATSGVQDVISGLSKDKNRVKYGHDLSYWTRRGKEDNWKEVTSETFANMNSALIKGGTTEEAFQKYFPESYKMFKEEVKNHVK